MATTNQAGKGDKPRPVNKTIYNQNYDGINWGHKPKKKTNKAVDFVQN